MLFESMTSAKTTVSFSSSVDRESGSALQFGAAQTVVNRWTAPSFFHDVSPDAKKILLNRVSQQVSPSVTLVTNFTADLKK